jgi:hypothetical protein
MSEQNDELYVKPSDDQSPARQKEAVLEAIRLMEQARFGVAQRFGWEDETALSIADAIAELVSSAMLCEGVVISEEEIYEIRMQLKGE